MLILVSWICLLHFFECLEFFYQVHMLLFYYFVNKKDFIRSRIMSYYFFLLFSSTLNKKVLFWKESKQEH